MGVVSEGDLLEIPDWIRGNDRRLLERLRVEDPRLFDVALKTLLNVESKRPAPPPRPLPDSDPPEGWWNQ